MRRAKSEEAERIREAEGGKMEDRKIGRGREEKKQKRDLLCDLNKGLSFRQFERRDELSLGKGKREGLVGPPPQVLNK